MSEIHKIVFAAAIEGGAMTKEQTDFITNHKAQNGYGSGTFSKGSGGYGHGHGTMDGWEHS